MCIHKEHCKLNEGHSNLPHLMDLALHSPQETYQLPNSNLALEFISTINTYCS